MLKMRGNPDTLNIHDDHPIVLFGPHVEEMDDTEDIPLFYVSLKVHDMTMDNSILYSGSSHNIMPKVFMDELGLDITRPYKDLFSFDSRKVKCFSLIKDFFVSLAQIPSNNLVMDVVVADIPPVGIGANPWFNASTTHQQNPNYQPFQQHLRSRRCLTRGRDRGVTGIRCL
jgi:hypothetical protein